MKNAQWIKGLVKRKRYVCERRKVFAETIRADGNNQNPFENGMWLKDLSKHRAELFRV
jgi:hypothetical protein